MVPNKTTALSKKASPKGTKKSLAQEPRKDAARSRASRAEEVESLYLAHVNDLIARGSEVLTRLGIDRLVIHSGSPLRRTTFDDQFWPLRPNPHFQHWFPLSQAGACLLIAPGKKPKLMWPAIPNFWESPGTAPNDYYANVFAVERPTSAKAAQDTVKRFISGKKKAFVGDDLRAARDLGFSAPEVNAPRLVRELDRLRVEKTDYEIFCLREANRIAAKGHDELLRAFESGDASELELHLLYLRLTEQDDPETPYKNIVALGESAATLHHDHYNKNREPKTADTLLLDAGATFLGYCSDITRTWVKGTGATASAFKGLVDEMETMQKKLCDDVVVGKKYEVLHDDSHRGVSRILSQSGIVKLSPEETYKAGISRAFYPHGLGHSLGLVCHDVGCALIKPRPENPFLRNTTTMAPRQCFTIEPGLYFIEPLLAKLKESKHGTKVNWKLVEALSPLGGIRIEDDIVVTAGEERIDNLTRDYLPVGGASV